ncbi:Vps54 family protein, partial [Toxoplasma gondii FOU]
MRGAMANTPRQTLLPRVEEEETFSSGCLSPHWQRNLLQELQSAQSISAVVNVPGSLQPSSVFSFLTENSRFASLEDPVDFSPRRASAGGTAKEISFSDFDGYFDSLKEELSQFGAICAADREAATARQAGGSLSLSARRRENAELLAASTRRMQRSRVRLGPTEALGGERSSPLSCSNEGAENAESPLEDGETGSRLLAEAEDARSVEAGGVDEEDLFLCDEEDELDAADACSSVPECFFSPNFQLSDFLGYDLPEAVKIHDELSTCLDEVECSLVALLSRRFSFFVRSLWMLTSLQTEIDGALRTVAALRGEFKKMQAERVELGLKVLRLTKERQGLLVYLRRMEFLSYVRDCMQSLEILQQAKEFATCLKLIEATRAVMTEELAALHVARPIRLQLDELQHRITRSLIDDFAAASLTAVFPPHYDAQSATLVSALLNVLNSPSLFSASSSPPSLSPASSSSSPSLPLSSPHAVGAARLLEPWIRKVASTDSLLHWRSASERPDARQESRGLDEREVTSALAVLYGDWARGWTLGIEEEDANPFDDRGVFTWEQASPPCRQAIER